MSEADLQHRIGRVLAPGGRGLRVRETDGREDTV